MRGRIGALALATLVVALFALAGGTAQAVDPVIPADHQEFLSGGATEPDFEALVAGPGSPTGGGAPPRVGPNVRANAPQQAAPNGLLGRSETTIAATTDGKLLLVGWNDAQGFCGPPFGSACTPQSPPGLSGWAFSTDGGATFTDGGGPDLLGTNVLTRGDPWMDRGGADNATFYYANLAVHKTTGASLGISVHRGHFSGGTFAWEDIHTFDSPNNPGSCVTLQPPPAPPVPTPCDFYDKEALVAAKDGSGSAYVSLTNFQGQPTISATCGNQAQFGFGQIEVWRTHDGGNTWQGPAIAGPEAPDSVASCGNLGTLRQSSAPGIGPNGEVYVVSQFGPTFTPATSTDADIVFARSLDGGASFAPQVKVADINSMRQNPPVGYNRDRINDHPRIDVATSGANKGRVYAVYYSAVAPVTAPPATLASCLLPPPPPPATQFVCRAQTLTSSKVFLKHSDDQGATWSSPIEIGGPVPATGVKRLWPDVNVSPGGTINVTYYESRETQATANPTDVECNINVGGGIRRQALNSSLVDTWWTYSSDGGSSWSMPLKLSSATSNWCTAASNIRPNFGDYIDSVAGGNRIIASWADSRVGVPDTVVATGLAAGKAGP
jgi:hypothetical protein